MIATDETVSVNHKHEGSLICLIFFTSNRLEKLAEIYAHRLLKDS